MRRLYLFRASTAVLVLAWLSGCAELETTAPTSVAPPPQGYWNGDGISGSPKIIVSISEQRAYFYIGKQLVGESTVSTGKPGFGTPPGYYTVFWKHADHVSSVFGDYVDGSGNVVKSNIDSRKDSKPPGSHYDGARMPFAMFFRGGYAMHQGYVPPYAASHGCIRLPQGMAEIFFNASPPGTPVIVKQERVMRTVSAPETAPSAATFPPPAPTLVRSTAPPPQTRPVAVLSTPTPVPLRSTASTRSSAPGTYPFRSPSPAPVRSPAPNLVRPTTVQPTVTTTNPLPVRSPNPMVRGTPPPVRSTSVRSTAPAPTPVPVRSPAPTLSRTPGPVRSPTPLPSLRAPSPAPVRSPAPAPVKATPPPVPSKTKHRVQSSHHRPAPSSTPSPAPR